MDTAVSSRSVKDREIQALAVVDAELDEIAAEWRKHDQKGLELYHEAGALLNRSLGDPAKRLPYGGKILEKVAATLEASQSELNRMRWFAHLFESVADFRQKHPDSTWTAFKKALPNLKGSKAPKGKPTAKKLTAATKLAKALKSVAAITKKLAQIDNLDGDELVTPLTTLREKVKKLAEYVGLHVTE